MSESIHLHDTMEREKAQMGLQYFFGSVSAKGIRKPDEKSPEPEFKGFKLGDGNKAGRNGTATIPNKAVEVANKVKGNGGVAPQGYKGGRTFKNIPVKEGDQKLPEGVNYKEYDVNPFVKGQNRGAERLVIGNDGTVWYTNNHYRTFTELE